MTALKCTCPNVRHVLTGEDTTAARLAEREARAAGNAELVGYYVEKQEPCPTAPIPQPALTRPAPVTAAVDAPWFRVAVTVTADAVSGTDLLDQLAAAFAEDPDGISERLLELNALNGQLDSDRHNGDDVLAEHSGAQVDAARQALAKDLPVDVTVLLTEREGRGLADAVLSAARQVFSARIWHGARPQRVAEAMGRVA